MNISLPFLRILGADYIIVRLCFNKEEIQDGERKREKQKERITFKLILSEIWYECFILK